MGIWDLYPIDDGWLMILWDYTTQCIGICNSRQGNVGKPSETTQIAFLYPSKAARSFFLAWENRISIAAISSRRIRPTYFFFNSGDVSISAIKYLT